MKKLFYFAAIAIAAAACGTKESEIEKYEVDYYPEIKGIKIAEVKAENEFVSTSEKVLFYDNPHTTRLLEISDSGDYSISVNLTVVAHCVSAFGQGACFYVSPLICLYTIDSIEVKDSIYIDNNLNDSVYVNNALYIRNSTHPDNNLYVNRSNRVNTLKKVLYAGEKMNATTLVSVSEIENVNAVTISKSAVHAMDSQHISVLEHKLLVPKRGVAYVAFEIASDIYTAQCYASNAAGGVGYAVIYIEPVANGEMASAQMLPHN
jgi:hypothetical protein